MTSAVYPLYKQEVLKGTSNTPLTGTLKAALVTSSYVYSAAHQFYSSVTNVLGTPVALTTKTYTNGLLDADDTVFSSVSGGTVAAIVLYLDTGTAGTSPLVAYIDGLSLVANGGNITSVWNASGIIQF